MQDFRLKVFLTAARTLNFTKCAEQLYISQPAVSKNISELEKHYGVKLFTRRGSSLELTDAGRVLEQWSERITSLYFQLEHEMSLLGQFTHGELRIGASTTIAQYVLPSLIARFTHCYPEIKISMISDNSEKIEQALFAHEIDLGFVENISRRGGLHYKHFADDSLVVVSGANNKVKGKISLEDLKQCQFVLRESGSGTLELISRRLSAAGITISGLNVVAYLGSSEAIKSYIESSDALAIISIAAVRKEIHAGHLRVIDVDGLEFNREFAAVSCQGEYNSLAERFLDFISNLIKG